MTWITKSDFQDLAYRLELKGFKWMSKRFRWSESDRVGGRWEETELQTSDWWIIPEVRQRWNHLISGASEIIYQDHVADDFFKGQEDLSMLSPGCGTGTQEIRWAATGKFERIDAFDLAEPLIIHAKNEADRQYPGICNFFTADIYRYNWPDQEYDIIHFYSSLHHFKNVQELLLNCKKALKPDGILIIHEYTGPSRFQWSSDQIQACNELLSGIPQEYRTKLGTGKIKEEVSCPGTLRMYLSDPSEAVEAQTIIPLVHENFEVIQESKLGGNLLHLVLKDIAHHFVDDNPEAKEILQMLFAEEDKFLESHASDFMFGVFHSGA